MGSLKCKELDCLRERSKALIENLLIWVISVNPPEGIRFSNAGWLNGLGCLGCFGGSDDLRVNKGYLKQFHIFIIH